MDKSLCSKATSADEVPTPGYMYNEMRSREQAVCFTSSQASRARARPASSTSCSGYRGQLSPGHMSENERTLSSPPSDGVSAVRFGTDGGTLLVSSWDSALRLYDVRSNSVLACLLQPSPLLDCDLLPDGQALSAGLDGAVRLHATATGNERTLGSHEGGVRCVRHCAAANAVVSGSWDRSLKLWDVRSPSPCVGTYAQPEKVLAMCAGTPAGGERAPLLVVGMCGRHVHVIDLRKPEEALQKRESSLKCQTRCVAQMPSGEGYALGSVEGRVAIEYFEPDEKTQEKKYAFKCHRAAVEGGDGVYPVNAIAFHPRHGTFATGGCDGVVNVWDAANKKKICNLRKCPTSIAALAFSPSGDAIAIASSYTFEQGDKTTAPDEIIVKKLADTDCKPKPRAA